MVMTNIVPFDFESKQVRVVVIDGEPWFVAADVAKVLEYSQPHKMLNLLDDDEKGSSNLDTPGGNQDMAVVSESGLYHAVIKSRKPQAKQFRRWVTESVIPSIRKTGTYSVTAPEKQMTQIQILVAVTQQMAQQERQLIEQERQTRELAHRIESVEFEQDRYSTPSGHKYTILGFAAKQGIKISAKDASNKGRRASDLCRQKGIEIERIYDPRFGYVGLYPEDILLIVFA